MQNTNSQYNLPEVGHKIAYKANRAGVAERFDDASVQKSIQVDLGLIDYYDTPLNELELYITRHAKAHEVNAFYRLRSVPGLPLPGNIGIIQCRHLLTMRHRGVHLMQSTTVGIDLAKSTFRISVADRQRHIAQRRRSTRAQFERFIVHTPPARSVMEGCASAHHWRRLAQAHGHRVKLLHAHYVRAYVRRNKTDASDADALVRADGDRDLKPIGVKPVHRQALQSLHRIRAQWQRARVARIFEARSSMAELAVVLPRGAQEIAQRLFDALDQLPELLAVAEWASSSPRSAK